MNAIYVDGNAYHRGFYESLTGVWHKNKVFLAVKQMVVNLRIFCGVTYINEKCQVLEMIIAKNNLYMQCFLLYYIPLMLSLNVMWFAASLKSLCFFQFA